MSDRSIEISRQRRRLLALRPAERLEAILSAPRPRELVRSLPAQELYLTLIESGIDRGLPLLPLASRHQLDFLLDVDGWSGDEFDSARIARWLDAFGQSDPDLVARWLLEADEATVVLALHRMIHVYKLDETTSQDFWPPEDRDVPSLDGVYFLEGREGVPDVALAALWRGLALARERARGAVEALLEQVLWLVPAEQQELAWEGRWSRLAERGFPDIDEALEVWAAGEAADEAWRTARARSLRAEAASRAESSGRVAKAGEASPRPGPRALPGPLLSGDAPLARAVATLDADDRDRVLHDLVRLGNRFAVASGADLGDPGTHAAGLDAAASLVQLGALIVAAGGDDEAVGGVLVAAPLAELSSLGVGAVEQRAARARGLVAGSGWLARTHLGRERLDAELDEMLEGLLAPRPRLVSGDAGRWIREPADLEAIDRALDTIEALGAFVVHHVDAVAGREIPELERLPAGHSRASEIDWSSVALTALARLAIGEEPRPRPLARADLPRVLTALGLGPGIPRSERPLEALAARLDLLPALEYLERRLTGEFGELADPSALDPRYARALLFERIAADQSGGAARIRTGE